ncbi:4576_t:CDS:1, partial [Paraglomus occultum]
DYYCVVRLSGSQKKITYSFLSKENYLLETEEYGNGMCGRSDRHEAMNFIRIIYLGRQGYL